jgi:DNA-binding NarL/FixJ family response regulator
MRILIADDHEVVRSGLRSVLEARSGWKVIGEAQDGKDAIRKAIELRPNVAILDYGLPVANGVDATGEIRKGAPGVEVLIFTMHENEALIRKTFAAGARGYLLKSDIKQDLYAAIESVAGHRPYFSTSISKTLLNSYVSQPRAESDPLTRRESLVVQLVGEGKTNKQAARVLNMSVKTVETHRAAAIRKLGISSTAGLVRYAVRTKLIEP